MILFNTFGKISQNFELLKLKMKTKFKLHSELTCSETSCQYDDKVIYDSASASTKTLTRPLVIM